MTAIGIATTYLANKLLDHTFDNVAYTRPANVYLGLLTVPASPDTAGTEVTGGGYGRVAITFAAASGSAIVSNASVAFSPLQTAAAQTVVWWGIYDASTAGNLLFQGPLPFAQTIPANTNISFASGAFTCRFGEDISTYLANKWLEHVLKNTLFSSPATVYGLLYSDSTLATEVTGGSYARQALSFAAASARQSISDTSESWTMPTTTVYGWGIADASSSGNTLISDQLRDDAGNTVTRPYTATDTADIAAGDIIVKVG